MMVAGMSTVTLSVLLLMVATAASIAASESMVLMDPEVPLKKCRYWRTRDLLQVLCKDLKLNEIPKGMQKGIDVLDARENRIRELNNDTLSRYSSLRFLYLQDNFIQKVTPGAFESTEYLEVLDLAKNGLTELPKNVFQLEALRNLYLSDNQLTDDQFDVQNIRSPLIWVHVAENKLTRIPQLSPLTGLTLLNVSHNPITRITVDDLAPLCSLQELDISEIPIRFNQTTCECYEFKEWIKLRHIKLINAKTNIDCPVALRDRCRNPEFSNYTMTLYNNCRMLVQDKIQAQRARTVWIWIASCIGAFVMFIFIALCCMHARNRDKRRAFRQEEILEANNANTEQLLNKENSKHEHP